MAIIQIRLRRGTSAEWTSANPVLAGGEPGWETDTAKGKVGDGVTPWSGLAYKLGGAGTGAVTSVNGETGVVVLTAAEVGAAAVSHSHATGDITGLTEVVQDLVAGMVVAGTNITATYNDSAGTLTLASTGGGGGGVSSVNTRTGAVVLAKTDVGLGNVDNTADVDKPVSTAQQDEIDLHADLVGGLVPTSQLPLSQSGTASSVAQRRSTGTLVAAAATAADELVNKTQLDAAAGVVADVRPRRVSATTLSNNDATTWIGANDLDITGVKTGDIWRVSLEIVYWATQVGGIDVRLKTTGIFLDTTNWQVTGHWEGLQFLAGTTQNSDVRQEVILYPTSHPSGHGGANVTLIGGGSAAAPGGRGVAKGEFEIKCLGSGLTGQAIGVEFRQHALDAANPTQLLAGSYLTGVNTI